MKAIEANRLSNDNQYSQVDKELEEIFDHIKKEAEQGYCHLTWYGEINVAMADRLTNLGYIEYLEGDHHIIRWDHKTL